MSEGSTNPESPRINSMSESPEREVIRPQDEARRPGIHKRFAAKRNAEDGANQDKTPLDPGEVATLDALMASLGSTDIPSTLSEPTGSGKTLSTTENPQKA